MAATIQSGSDGSVDTRTISDADVKRIGNALRVNIANAIRGKTTVIDDIIIDANNKIFMLDSLTAPNRRKQSAALILNRYLENVSLFDQRSLLKYEKTPTAEELGLKEIENTKVDKLSNLRIKFDLIEPSFIFLLSGKPCPIIFLFIRS